MQSEYAGSCTLPVFSTKRIVCRPLKTSKYGVKQRRNKRRWRDRQSASRASKSRRRAIHTDMNPVLLKPTTDTGAQVIIHGKAVTDIQATAYHDYKNCYASSVSVASTPHLTYMITLSSRVPVVRLK